MLVISSENSNINQINLEMSLPFIPFLSNVADWHEGLLFNTEIVSQSHHHQRWFSS